MKELCKACEETNTLMESALVTRTSPRRKSEIAANYDVKFAISSDAHVPDKVGTYIAGVERALGGRAQSGENCQY